MILARIVGTVVATRKDPRLVSNKLLVARPMDPHGKAEGNYLVAVDTVDAGVGETVLIVSGSSATDGRGHERLPDRCRDRRNRGPRGGRRRRLSRPMQLAKVVIGDVVVTIKDANLHGIKLMVLQPLAPDGSPVGRTLVAVDAVGAGVGETVFFVRGKEASLSVPSDRGPDGRRHRRHRRSGRLGRDPGSGSKADECL